MKLRASHCQCSVCLLYFNSTAAFDKHRTGDWLDRRCLSISEMEAKGMALNARSFWVTAAMPILASGRPIAAAIGATPVKP
jgi:hypothetical protein